MASLEQQGTVLIWLLIETQDHEPSATDYGQAVGGRVRLFRSGHVPLNAGQYDANATGEEVARRRGVGDAALLPLRTLCLAFSPAEASRFLVGCDTGRVLHGSRHAGRSVAMPTPRTFEPEVSHATAGVPACTVHGLAFCPLAGLQGYMVAARSDGSLALYQTDDARPLRTWQGFTTAALLQARRSNTRRAHTACTHGVCTRRAHAACTHTACTRGVHPRTAPRRRLCPPRSSAPSSLRAS